MPENQQRTPSGHSGSRQRGVLPSLYLGMMAAALATGAWAQEHPQHNDAVAQPGQGRMRGQMQGPMRGMMGEGRQDMDSIHALFSAHQQIARTVKKLDTGVETLTESADPKVQALIREHVQTMYQRLSAGQPIRQWDPLYAEIFRQAGKIHMELSNTAKGIKVIETSTDPWVVKLLHAHADGVSEFVDQGMAAMHKAHPLPAAVSEPRANSEKVVPEMKVLPLRTSVGVGKDKEVEQLYEGPGRKLVQITLRNNGILEAHKAAVPITIQCVAGSGILKVADATEPFELKPGVLVTIEANVLHEIKANPDVLILLTQFTGKP